MKSVLATVFLFALLCACLPIMAIRAAIAALLPEDDR
jgi:hypothetical protein